MDDKRENERTPQDKVIASLFVEAERSRLPGEPSYDGSAGLARFRAWLGANSEDTGGLPAGAARPPASTGNLPDRDLGWLITDFAERVPDVAHVVVASQEGLPLALSAGVPPQFTDQLAALVSGMTSLTNGTSRVLNGGAVVRTMVKMEQGVLLIMAISNVASLAVLAAPDCDTELLAYEMSLLAERVGGMLTSATRADAHAIHRSGA